MDSLGLAWVVEDESQQAATRRVVSIRPAARGYSTIE